MLVVLATVLLAAAPVQQPAPADSLLRVFVDCPNYVPGCDLDFLRTEVTWIDYVRDRESADIHALATALQTGGGGWGYTVALIGRGRWAGRVDTLTFAAPGTATFDEQRRAFARHLALGLVRYGMGTAAAPRLTLSYRAPGAAERQASAQARDRWDSWVFRIGFNGSAYVEDLYRSSRQNGNLSANRTTDRWKLAASVNYSENSSRSIYELRDTINLDSVVFADTSRLFNKDYGANVSVVRSLGSHWSARVSSQFNRSTRRNILRQVSAGPAIEYNFFPYSESTRRQLTVQVGTRLTHFAYDSITIYDKIRETRPITDLNGSLDITQPWGNGTVGIGHTVYLDNSQQNSSFLFAFANLRLFRGFSVNFYGNYNRVRDQLYLKKSGASRDDVLLQRRALATNYSYQYQIGVSYRFGSTNNNVVNPRFGGGGGMFFFE